MAEPQEEQTAERTSTPNKHTPPFWEWLAAACGLVLVLGAIGSLVYHGLTSRTTPPNVHVQATGVYPASHGYVVEIRVRNYGGTTAQDLTVEGELHHGSERLETSQITIDYVPARAQRAGGLFFTRDPRHFTLQLHPRGYQRP